MLPLAIPWSPGRTSQVRSRIRCIRKLCDGIGATWGQPHTNLGQHSFQALDESGYG
jgi:hypothetical protein